MAEDKRSVILDIEVDNSKAITKIASLSKVIDDNKKHVKDLQKQIKELDETSNDYAEQVQAINEEIVATNIETSEYRKTVNDLTKAVTNSMRASEGEKSSLKALRAELANLTREYDNLERAQRVGEGSRGEQLKAQIADITAEIKGNEEATGRFQRNVGNYENAIRDALGANSGFASSLLGLADNMGIANGVMPALKGNIAGLGGAMKMLLANPVFLTMFGVGKAGEAVKFWFDFNKGLSEATRLTEQFTGLTGDALVNYRDEVQAVADVYKKDFNEVLRSANAIAQQFGISYDDAINVIKDGFVAGADVGGEFLDVIREYPAFFREAGLSAEAFVAISTEAAKSGVYSDKGVDAIKEATIRLREMTTATDEALAGIGLSGQAIQQAMAEGSMTAFDAIQKISEKLNELPATSSAVGTAVADIFGGAGEDAGLQYLKTLKDISTDLDEVKGKAGEYATLQDDYLESQIALQTATNELFGMTGTTFDDLVTKGKTFLNDSLASILNVILNLDEYTRNLYNESVGVRVIWETLSGIFKAVFALLKNSFGGLMDTIKAIGTMWEGIFTLDLGKIKQGYADAGKALVNMVKNDAKDIGEIIGAGFGNVKNGAPVTSTSTAGSPTKPTVVEPLNIVVTPTATPTATATDAGKEMQKAKDDLQKYEEELRKIVRENTGTLIDQINAKYDAEVANLENLFEEHKGYSDDVVALEAQKDAAIVALNDQRNAEIAEANKQASDEELKRKQEEWQKLTEQEQLERATKLMQMQIDGATDKELLQEQERQINEAINNLRQEDFESKEHYENAKTELELQQSELRKQIQAEDMARAQSIAGATTSLMSSISQLIVATTEDEEEAARKAKALALAEIAINTGVAIAEGITSAMSVPFPANLVAIATTIATVMANIATAITTVKGAKFAEGGLVTGEGTATSDSIPAMLSNGESVMTAQATSMFAPMLSAFNQMGGGVPIPAQGGNSANGEELLARAFARGVANMPNPVVDVQEIARVNKRVEVLESLATA